MADKPVMRGLVLTMINPIIGDNFFTEEVAQALREYAEMLERDTAGHHNAEHFVSKGGTSVTVLAGRFREHNIPY